MTDIINGWEKDPAYGWTLQLDSEGDLFFDGDNRLGWVGGKVYRGDVEVDTKGSKIQQDMSVLFRTMRGDNIFHINVGLDYETLVAGKFEDHIVDSVIRQTLATYSFAFRIDQISITRTRIVGGEDMVWDVKMNIEWLGFFTFQVGL